MNKVSLLIAVIILAGAVAGTEGVYLARRAATPTPVALAPATPTSAASNTSGLRPKKPRPAKLAVKSPSGAADSATPADENLRASVMDANFTSASTGTSAASATAARSDVELDQAREVLAEHQVDNILAALNLTDVQLQAGKDAIDQFRTAMKGLLGSGQGFNETLKSKVGGFRNQGLTDDQIAGLIRPDLEAVADRMTAQVNAMSAAMLQLQPIMNPDQLKTLNGLSTGFQAAPAQIKKMLTSDSQLKMFVQMAK